MFRNSRFICSLFFVDKELQYAFQSFGMGDVIKAVVDVLIQKGKSAEPPLDVHLWYSLFNGRFSFLSRPLLFVTKID
jgi:hypothetical protein